MNYTYKQIWFINFPVMMNLLTEQLINITDAIFLGHYNQLALGAAALGGIFYLSFYMLGFGFSLGLQVLIARRNGEKQFQQTGAVFSQGLIFFLLTSFLLFFFLHFLSPSLLPYLISSDEICREVENYLKWRSFGILFSFPALAWRAFFVGITKTRILNLNAVILVGSNIVLNYLLIFGKLGFPQMGLEGAAIASTAAEGIALILFVFYTWKNVDRTHYGIRIHYNKQLMTKLINLSVWSMFYSFISVAPWFLFYVSIERLGEQSLAISNIIRSISTFFFVIATSFSTTTGSLVSNLIGQGAGNEISSLCRKIIRISYCTGIPLILIILIFPEQTLGIYTNNETLIKEGVFPMIVMLSVFLISVPAFIYSNAVTGTGNTKISFLLQVVTIILYLIYLGILNVTNVTQLAIYCTVEHLFVLSILILAKRYLSKEGNIIRKI